jgi:hypothetical protein
VGEHSVPIKLHREIVASITVVVHADGASASEEPGEEDDRAGGGDDDDDEGAESDAD